MKVPVITTKAINLLCLFISNSFQVVYANSARLICWHRSTLSAAAIFIVLMLAPSGAVAEIVKWEGGIPPVDAGFILASQNPILETWLDAGGYFQYVERPSDRVPVASEVFVTPFPQFDCAPELFFEWQLVSDGNSEEFFLGGPSALVVGNFGGADYTFFIAKDEVKYSTLAFAVQLFLPIEPDLPHVYRIEMYADTFYQVWIDGQVVDEGIPTAPLCGFSPKITWGAQSAFAPSTTAWHFIRYGIPPEPASGDYDSSGAIDLADWYFVQDCLMNDGIGIYGGPGGPCPDGDETCQAIGETTTAGPGCTFADFDGDNDIDLRDIAVFLAAFNPAP